ncbi:hypothetical protein [Acinetobacter sp. ESBL14]|uniref:hypothetical protein n=1 Tax=Acinetobacter sp. ESBL14 TaxID=3077329 RepID=UPI002FC89983
MRNFNYLILFIGLGLVLSACNKDAELKRQTVSITETAQTDYSNVPPDQFKGQLSFFKEQLDKIFNDQKYILRDEGIAFAPTQGFLVVQLPVEKLDDETYQKNIVTKIKENGWTFNKSIKNADIFCNGKKYQLEVIKPKESSKDIINEEDKLTFSPIDKEWNIGMFYQEQGTPFCGDGLPVITIK